jgi:hypothetical protein
MADPPRPDSFRQTLADALRGALVAIGLLMPALVVLRWRALTRLEAGAAVPEEAFRLLRSLPPFAPLPLGMVE